MQITINTANTWEYKTVTIPATTYDNGMPADNALGFNLWLSFNGIVSGNKLTSYGVWENATNRLGGPVGDTNVFAGTTGATFLYTGMQIEVGERATGYEHVPFSVDLARCQRYFQTYVDPPARGVVGGSNAVNRAAFTLPVLMRATPTADLVGTLDVYDGIHSRTITSLGATYNTSFSVEFDASTLGGSAFTAGNAATVYNHTNNGRINIDCDL